MALAATVALLVIGLGAHTPYPAIIAPLAASGLGVRTTLEICAGPAALSVLATPLLARRGESSQGSAATI